MRLHKISLVVLACLLSVSVRCAWAEAATETETVPKALPASLVGEIVYAVRPLARDGHWYANLGYFIESPNRPAFGQGGISKLCKYNVGTGKTTVLLEDPTGGIRDPQVHYDAKKILFSYRKGGQGQYHLYEIGVDGKGLRQLTDGVFDELEPAYLPDGGIVFVSTRSKRWVQCWKTQVATLYRCDGDGNNVQTLSCNIEQDNTPWVLPDGRILYTRWEYIHRSQVRFHHLWTMNPDGTNQQVFFGNMHPDSVYIDAKPIPGTDKILVTDSPGHGRREHAGNLSVLSVKNGPDDKRGLRKVNLPGYRDIRDPYPLNTDHFLFASDKDIAVVNGKGEVTTLVTGRNLHEPRAIRKRPRERIVPSRTNLNRTTGTLALQDITIGRNMKGVKRGDITKILIVEGLPKPINYGGGHLDFVPISWGGTFTIERILGTIPVEPDGSAFFTVPALRPLTFIALDKNGLTVKRMHSFLSVMPGENLSCIGCHEDRTITPPMQTKKLLALTRGPSPITPVPNVPEIIDYARDIQPIWNKSCISCHNPKKLAGDIDLTDDYGQLYFMSFIELFNHGQISDGRNGIGNSAPRSVGDVKSALMQKIDGSHHKVKLSPKEIELVRHWIHIGAPQMGTYAALGTGMIDLGNREILSQLKLTNEAADVIQRRCSGCHGKKKLAGKLPRFHQGWPWWRGSEQRQLPPGKVFDRLLTHRVYNLKQPDKSRILTAPLARAAGGRGMAKYDRKTHKHVGEVHQVFKSTDDPDYQILLKMLQSAQAYLQKDKRWHEPGFQPNKDYIREMKRYGIIPESFDPATEKLDPYKTDKTYWESFWHYTPGTEPKLYDNPKIKAALKCFPVKSVK